MMHRNDTTSKVLSADVLVSVLIDEFSKEIVTCIALFDTGSSKLVVDTVLMNVYAKKGIKQSPTRWKK